MRKKPSEKLSTVDPHTAPGNPEGLPVARVSIRVSDTHGRDASRYAATAETKVSLTRHNRELLSPDMQLESARRLCRIMGYWLDEAASLRYIDLNQSGSRKTWTKRPGITEHLEAAKRKEFEVIIFYKIARIGRNFREGLEIWDAFSNAGCTVGIAEERVDTSTAAGMLQRNMLFAIAQYVAEDISSNVKDAIDRHINSGKPWGKAPAWVWIDQHTGEKYVHPATKLALRRMAELRCLPVSTLKITRTLNAEGHRRPEPQSAGVEPARLWTMRAVQYHLSPHGIRLMRGHGSFGNQLEPGHPDRIIFENIYPAALTPEEADRLEAVQVTLSEAPLVNPMAAIIPEGVGKFQKSPRNTRGASTSYLVSGFATCAFCKSKLRATTGSNGNGDRNRYYMCMNATSQPELHKPRKNNVTSGNAMFSANSIEAAVTQCLVAALAPAYAIVNSNLGAVPLPQPAPVRKKGKADQYPRNKAEIARAVARIQDAYERDLYSESEYSSRLALLRREEQDREALDVQERMNQLLTPDVAEALRTAEEMGSGYSVETIRFLLQTITESIDLPHYIEGRKLNMGRAPEKSVDARFVRLTPKAGTLAAYGVRAILAEIRQSRYGKALKHGGSVKTVPPPVVWEMDNGQLLQEPPESIGRLLDDSIREKIAAPLTDIYRMWKGTRNKSHTILPMTDELRRALVNFLRAGGTVYSAEKASGIAHDRMRRIMQEEGIPTRKTGERSKLSKEEVRRLLEPLEEVVAQARADYMKTKEEARERKERLHCEALERFQLPPSKLQ